VLPEFCAGSKLDLQVQTRRTPRVWRRHQAPATVLPDLLLI